MPRVDFIFRLLAILWVVSIEASILPALHTHKPISTHSQKIFHGISHQFNTLGSNVFTQLEKTVKFSKKDEVPETTASTSRTKPSNKSNSRKQTLTPLASATSQPFKFPQIFRAPTLHYNNKLTFWGNMIAGAVSRR